MTTPFITTGVPTTPGSNGPIPVRREIRDLQKNHPVQWNLFLLGLRAMQTMKEDDYLSYYQISGIHGLPYIPWNGVTGIGDQQAGYCTHSSILFLPWHRPYLALFEQLLYSHIQTIATKFPQNIRSRYVEEAKDFRLPYWDWGLLPAAGQNSLPSAIAGPEKILVTDTDGKQDTIPNPLYGYQFDTDVSAQDFPDSPFDVWQKTQRYPSNGRPNAQSQNSQLNAAINSQSRNIRSMVRYIMNAIPTFGPFSNDEWIPNQAGAYASLEDIHDNIHGLIGGPSPGPRPAPPGHMSIIPYAAFDPIFWLHHCNVDRLFAMWQVLHPNSYVEPELSTSGTFTRIAGDTEDGSSPLTPFRQNPSTFYTPQSARTTKAFGYAYPETQWWMYPSTSDYQRSVAAAIARLYGTQPQPRGFPAQSFMAASAVVGDQLASVPMVSRSRTDAPKAPQTINDKSVGESKVETTAPAIERVHEVHNPGPHNPGPHNPGKSHDFPSESLAPEGQYKEWIVNIRAPKHVLHGLYQVHIFIGDVPDSVDAWIVHDNNVGTYTVLGSNPLTTNCEKCRTDAGRELVVTGIIPLTEALTEQISKGELRSLEPNDVVPYLKEQLHWRVTQADGTDKPREEFPGLQVSVVSTDVSPPSDSHILPVYSGQYTLHPGCTEGRPCGYNDGDQY